MWSMPVVLTKTENENDSANQNYVAKMTLQNGIAGPNSVVCRRHNLRLLIYHERLSILHLWLGGGLILTQEAYVCQK